MPLVLLHCLCTSSSRRYVREDTVRNTYRHQQQEKSVFNKKKKHAHSQLSFFFFCPSHTQGSWPLNLFRHRAPAFFPLFKIKVDVFQRISRDASKARELERCAGPGTTKVYTGSNARFSQRNPIVTTVCAYKFQHYPRHE